MNNKDTIDIIDTKISQIVMDLIESYNIDQRPQKNPTVHEHFTINVFVDLLVKNEIRIYLDSNIPDTKLTLTLENMVLTDTKIYKQSNFIRITPMFLNCVFENPTTQIRYQPKYIENCIVKYI